LVSSAYNTDAEQTNRATRVIRIRFMGGVQPQRKGSGLQPIFEQSKSSPLKPPFLRSPRPFCLMHHFANNGDVTIICETAH
jgi:hypothetical protein